MLSKIKKSNNSEGFTIIEVMIVLAVAALILLIVLLAVPALQRNSRNTALKNDASTVAGGISTFESDNEGTVPTLVTTTYNSTNIPGDTQGAAGTAYITNGTNSENVSLQGSTTVVYDATVGDVPTATSKINGTTITTGTIYVINGSTCNGGGAVSATGASSRTFAIVFLEETSGSPILQCVTS